MYNSFVYERAKFQVIRKIQLAVIYKLQGEPFFSKYNSYQSYTDINFMTLEFVEMKSVASSEKIVNTLDQAQWVKALDA